MTITLDPELQAAVNAAAQHQGITPEALVLKQLRERYLLKALKPRDDWERRLLAMGIDCGVSLSNEALSRDTMYD